VGPGAQPAGRPGAGRPPEPFPQPRNAPAPTELPAAPSHPPHHPQARACGGRCRRAHGSRWGAGSVRPVPKLPCPPSEASSPARPPNAPPCLSPSQIRQTWLAALLAGALAIPCLFNDQLFATVSAGSVVALSLSFGIPIALRMMDSRRFIPGPFSLGAWSRPVGVVALLWIALVRLGGARRGAPARGLAD
jgi:hypothetical protein